VTSQLSRRRFLSGLGAVTLLGAAGGIGRGFMESATAATTDMIDVHGHVLPPFWVDALRASGGSRVSGMAIPNWSPRAAVAFLDSKCINTQVVSLPDPAVTFLPQLSDRVTMARRVNDYVATELVHSTVHEGRFGGFATLPLADLSVGEQTEAVKEARRAVNELGLDGVSLLSNYGDTYLGDLKLAPLMLALNSQSAVVAVHSNAQGTAPAMDLGAALLEAPFNTTRAIVNMSYLQAFTLYPNIRWLFVDAGGTLPYLAYRSSLFLLYPVVAQNLGLDVGDLDEGNFQFADLYFDTAWSANPVTMTSLREIAPDSHVLLGTDWPLSARSLGDPTLGQGSLAGIFGDKYAAVSGANARALLPAMAARSGAAACGGGSAGGGGRTPSPSPSVSPTTNPVESQAPAPTDLPTAIAAGL